MPLSHRDPTDYVLSELVAGLNIGGSVGSRVAIRFTSSGAADKIGLLIGSLNPLFRLPLEHSRQGPPPHLIYVRAEAPCDCEVMQSILLFRTILDDLVSHSSPTRK